MVNALGDDMLHCDSPLAAVEQFLSWCAFPLHEPGPPDFTGLTGVTILVEQSCSDFGDLDLLLLLDHDDGRKQAVLLEAKVATDTSGRRPVVHAHWACFGQYRQGDLGQRSSLFVQLYRKLRLVRRVLDFDAVLPQGGVPQGWGLGSNRVVLKAARLLAEYAREPWYVALVPDDAGLVADFFENTLRPFTATPGSLPDWDVTRWGFLTWPDVHAKCKADEATWGQTLRNFDWNDGQVYRTAAQPGPGESAAAVEVGRVYGSNGRPVLVVASRTDDAECRVVPLVPGDGYFPRSFTVAKAGLGVWVEPLPATPPGDMRPRRDGTYWWSPPPGEGHTPPGRQSTPPPPCWVRVQTPGWKTSAVYGVTDAGQDEGPMFHVFSYHLRRL